jgi:hypothetical protein
MRESLRSYLDVGESLCDQLEGLPLVGRQDVRVHQSFRSCYGFDPWRHIPKRAIFGQSLKHFLTSKRRFPRKGYHAGYHAIGEDVMLFATSAKTVTRVLIVIVLFLTLAGLGAKFLRWILGDEGLLQLLTLFYVNEEAAIPTWYSSSTLLLSSVLLAVIAVAKRRNHDRYTLHWLGLSIIFLFLSMDEVIQVHEALGGAEIQPLLSNFLGLTPSGFIYHIWVVPGAAVVLVFVLAYLRFLIRLPQETRRLFLVAGTLFVLGALGLEILTARIIYEFGGIESWRENAGAIPQIIAGIITSIEELLEMLGIVVFVYALLSYIRSYMKGLTIRVGVDDS